MYISHIYNVMFIWKECLLGRFFFKNQFPATSPPYLQGALPFCHPLHWFPPSKFEEQKIKKKISVSPEKCLPIAFLQFSIFTCCFTAC